jgi:hypothetical protein
MVDWELVAGDITRTWRPDVPAPVLTSTDPSPNAGAVESADAKLASRHPTTTAYRGRRGRAAFVLDVRAELRVAVKLYLPCGQGTPANRPAAGHSALDLLVALHQRHSAAQRDN